MACPAGHRVSGSGEPGVKEKEVESVAHGGLVVKKAGQGVFRAVRSVALTLSNARAKAA